ncbi:MAG: hypothetical protein KY475_25410, partial [Planctomycetes bacterium]|nr:hypothetical protein [Planctomycetota bacterium]
DRARAAGYPGGVGENIAWGGSTGAIDELAHVYERHESLFHSPGHRDNLMQEHYVDAGAGVRFGQFTHQGATYNASMVALSFGFAVGGQITGVAFTDRITDDDFYDVGEGVGGLTITARDASGAEYTTQTGPSGGYTLAAPPGVYTVRASGGSLPSPIIVTGVQHGLGDFENTKIDFQTSEAPPADTTPPGATASVSDVTSAATTPQTIIVTYADDRGLDLSSFDSADLRITGPGDFSGAPALHAVTPLDADNLEVRVEYRLAPSGGTWDEGDDGTYSVRLQDGQVRDAAGNAAAGRQLASFVVQIGEVETGWHNAAQPADVDNSGDVSLADLLSIVTYLRQSPPGPLPPVDGPPPAGYVDVTGDGEATLADLLAAVTAIRESNAEPEAEAEATYAANVDGYFASIGDPWTEGRDRRANPQRDKALSKLHDAFGLGAR